MVVVAGSRASAVHELLTALLFGRYRLPHTPRHTYLALERGEERREPPRRLTESHAPRRLELTLPDALLDHVRILAARTVTADDESHHTMVLELLEQSAALILVTDGRTAYQPAELELLRSAAARNRAVFLVVTHADETGAWPEVVLANQESLARHLPRLAFEPWYPLGPRRSGVAELRRALVSWAAAECSRHGAVVTPSMPVVRVSPQAGESGWAQVLENGVGSARSELERYLVNCLAETRASCLSLPADELTTALDSALQLMSVDLARQLRLAVDRVVGSVLDRVLLVSAGPAALARIRAALHREIADEEGTGQDYYRAILVTTTAAAATITVTSPLDGLDAHAYEPDGAILPPLGIGLTSNCLPLWHTRSDDSPESPESPERALRWGQRALDDVEMEVLREVARQFGQLSEAITVLIAEGIDHDFLLL